MKMENIAASAAKMIYIVRAAYTKVLHFLLIILKMHADTHMT